MKFYIKDFFSKCDQIRRKLRIWSLLLKKSLTENFIFCAVITAWKVSKYGVFSCSYFPVSELNIRKYGSEKTLYLDTFHAVHFSESRKFIKKLKNGQFK